MRVGRPREGAEKICLECGAVFYVPPSRIGKTTCSIKCRDARRLKETFNRETNAKKCAKCGEWKSVESFVKSNTPSGCHSYCKVCSSTWFHERRGTDLADRKPYRPQLNLSKEERRIRRNEFAKKWRIANMPKVLMWNRLRMQRERSAGEMPHRHEVGRLMCMQDARCTYCRVLLSDQFHIDHKTPISRGGSNDIGNLQILCPTCNMKKGAKTHDEYMRILKVDELDLLDLTLERLA
jgi:5-methylcytosine-specific restriction endonuclease McrA